MLLGVVWSTKGGGVSVEGQHQMRQSGIKPYLTLCKTPHHPIAQTIPLSNPPRRKCSSSNAPAHPTRYPRTRDIAPHSPTRRRSDCSTAAPPKCKSPAASRFTRNCSSRTASSSGRKSCATPRSSSSRREPNGPRIMTRCAVLPTARGRSCWILSPSTCGRR